MSGALNVLLAGGAGPVTAQAAVASDTENSPSVAVATISFNNTGLVSSTGNGASTAFTWLNAGVASGYDIRFNSASVVGSGTLSGSALGATWYNLGTSRSVTLTSVGSSTGSLDTTYDIAFTGTTTPIVSGALALDVERVI